MPCKILCQRSICFLPFCIFAIQSSICLFMQCICIKSRWLIFPLSGNYSLICFCQPGCYGKILLHRKMHLQCLLDYMAGNRPCNLARPAMSKVHPACGLNDLYICTLYAKKVTAYIISINFLCL